MKRITKLIILLHIVILGVCLIYLPIFRSHRFYGEYTSAQDKVFAAVGYWDSLSECYHVDEQTGQSGVFTCGPYLDLPRGIYEITVTYKSEGMGHVCYAHDDDLRMYERGLYADKVPLDSNHSMKQFTVWVNKPAHYFEIRTEFSGEGMLEIQQVVVRQTMQTYFRNVFWVIILLVLFDSFLYLGKMIRRERVRKESLLIGFLLLGVVLFASAPFLQTGIVGVQLRKTIGDNNIHLMRIVGLAEGLRSGNFPVWIHPEWLNGYGYAMPLFYGDLFLYIPAILLLIGFPLFWVYNCYLILINVVTCLASYFCYRGMFRSKKIGLLCSVVSVWSVYHLSTQVSYESLGVFTSYAFLPLVVYGLYLVYVEPLAKRTWMILSLGMTGLIQSHLLTSEITGMAIFLVILLTGKRFWRKERVMAMIKSVAASVVLNLGFLVPFLCYMRKPLYLNAPTWTEYPWQIRGPSIAEHLTLFPGSGTERKTDFILLAGVFLFILICMELYGKKLEKEQEKYKYLGVIAAVVCVVFTWLSSGYFPWDWIYIYLPWTHWLTATIQESMRFAQLAQPFGIVVIGCTAWLVASEKMQWTRYFYIGILGLSLLSFGSVTSEYIKSGVIWKVYDMGALETSNIGTLEYLPAEAQPQKFVLEFPVIPDDMVVTNYSKRGTSVVFSGENLSASEVRVRLPLVYYWNYQAIDESGNNLLVECSEDKEVQVVIPTGFNGVVRVSFRAPVVWYLAHLTSVLVFGAMMIVLINNRDLVEKKEDNKEA